jgi:hypothetical protein
MLEDQDDDDDEQWIIIYYDNIISLYYTSCTRQRVAVALSALCVRRPTFALLRGIMFDCPANGPRQSPLLNSTRNAHQCTLTQLPYSPDI